MRGEFLRDWRNRWQQLVRFLKQQALTVFYVARHPKTPILVKVLALLIAGYAFSPIDLIPDFIPVLGLLDDALLLPLGLYLILKLTPVHVLVQCRAQAELSLTKPVSRVAGVVIVLIWLVGLVLLAALLWG